MLEGCNSREGPKYYFLNRGQNPTNSITRFQNGRLTLEFGKKLRLEKKQSVATHLPHLC